MFEGSALEILSGPSKTTSVVSKAVATLASSHMNSNNKSWVCQFSAPLSSKTRLMDASDLKNGHFHWGLVLARSFANEGFCRRALSLRSLAICEFTTL
jgi:hypothetical protein